MDNNTFEKLQYTELKEIVKTYCVSGLGKELIEKLQPSGNLKLVKKRLNETDEAVAILNMASYVPLEGISNIKNLIEKVDKGSILEPNELISISDFLRGCRKFKIFMEYKENISPVLWDYSRTISEFMSIEEEINISIKGARVSSTASKELKKIRRNIENAEENINERLDRFLKNSENKKYIQEFFISKRNDRYTIPIKASYKNYVEGIVVETSSKGSTVFIEPQVISKYTTELTMLKAEESVEEYRILATLTNMIYDSIREIKINIDAIAQFDMIFAKAKYSKSIEGIKPEINDYGYINIINGKHPLLKGKVVPLNFNIGENYRTLIITGPNAGGKTVVLKTVGLLTLAVESGFHIAVDKGTEVSLFDNVFVDIGDDQSLENSLSTFSSHMKNLSDIIKHCNKSTLIICDEIGSGTDPNEGAGLAIAILEEFYHRGSITIASTHYGEIKNYSKCHEDFENAAMLFEKETLEPLYKLIIGKSGKSNALWIANKMGIRKEVLEKAKLYIDNKEYNYDKVSDSKIKKHNTMTNIDENNIIHSQYEIGDSVILLDKNDKALVYESEDDKNLVTIFYNKEFIKVPKNRIKLNLKAKELYPEGYDLNSLFISYKERKFDHDIERGSKKALKKLKKKNGIIKTLEAN